MKKLPTIKIFILTFLIALANILIPQTSIADIGGKNSTPAPCITNGNVTAKANSTKNTIKSNYCVPPKSSPVISSISPNSGTTLGGTLINISGSSFAAGATVSMGSGNCTSLEVLSSILISCITPSGSNGSANITLINPDGGVYTLNSGFTYLEPCTTVTYSLVNSNVTKSGAESLANTGNSRLAQIKSSCEQDLVNNLISAQTGIYWIGATQNVSDGSWSWYDGTIFSDLYGQSLFSRFKNWYSTEPNDFTYGIAYGDACAVAAGGNSIFAFGKWYDIPCNAETGYILETGTR